MPRPVLTDDERARGRVLGQLLKRARGPRTAVEVARNADVPLDTLRRVEQGAVPTPGLFLIAKLAVELNLVLDDLVAATLVQQKGSS